MADTRRDHDAERQKAASVSVLVVDDRSSFRAVMREVVDATAGFELVGEAASGLAAAEAVRELAPALVIMDNRMPGMAGAQACRTLVERHPGLVVVITSVDSPDPSLIEWSRAAAFVRKQELSPRLLKDLWRTHGTAER